MYKVLNYYKKCPLNHINQDEPVNYFYVLKKYDNELKFPFIVLIKNIL